MINFVYGVQKNELAVNSLKKIFLKLKNEYTGTVYWGFALSELDNERVIADVLVVTKEKGVLAINFTKGNQALDIEQNDRILISLRSLFERNQKLRNRTNLVIQVHVVTYCIDNAVQADDYVDESSFIEYYKRIDDFQEKYFEALNESLDKIVSAKPKKLRRNVQQEGSLGAVIKKIEQQIANMDEWQKAAAYEIPDKPQRIRGLAGSGKTVVLALKAAYLHFWNEDADIAVVFYSRSLYEQFKKMISEFYVQYNRDSQVDFDKVHLLHAWGSLKEPGLYSEVAQRLEVPVYTYNEARMKHGQEQAFKGICDELSTYMDANSIDNLAMFDYILIDEAQDLPPSFFRIAYRLFKDCNKRQLVYAYDELQNLTQTAMPSLGEMFGTDEEGNSLVQIEDADDDSPKTDILLPICYRNTKWALSVAHALGFGVYRDVKERPLVQFFEDLDVWTKIGYKVIDGKLAYGEHVRLIRAKSPTYFEELMKPEDAVYVHPLFDKKEDEYLWICKEIKKNLTEDELDPDDILVIFPNPAEAQKHYGKFNQILRLMGIRSIMPGVNVGRDVFSQVGCITCTHIYRAKGNEKPMVYLADAEYGCQQSEIVHARNILFTAITRSRAWVRITGVGSGMEQIGKEIQKCQSLKYALDINIPSAEEIKKLNLLNKESVNKEETKKIEKASEALINLLNSSDFDINSIPQLKDLAKLIKQKDA